MPSLPHRQFTKPLADQLVLWQPLHFELDIFESINVFLGPREELLKKKYIIRTTDEER